MINEIKNARKNGDTLGGIVKCIIKNVPVGLGEPVFNKLHSELGRAMPVSYTHLTLPTKRIV